MQKYPTTDLSDKYETQIQIAAPGFADFGGVTDFYGPVLTLETVDDNTKVRAALEAPGAGRVLVVDGAASQNCALVGGNLAVLAQENGWAGIIVNGYVRDAAELAATNIGVKALGTMPRKSEKRDRGVYDVALRFAGVIIAPDAWIYADRDGIVVAGAALTLD